MKAGCFKRYILYAVGEVILILVGVLIAVSLNNSNNFWVKRLQEQQIVVRNSNEFNAGMTLFLNSSLRFSVASMYS